MRGPLFEFGVFGNGGAIVAAIVIGIGFGWCLERAGMGSARKLAAQFYLTDLTVFKVMFTAILTAMIGAFWLGRIGLLDLSRVYVPETYVLPQLAGGLMFGVGFAIAGLCPGTSCVAAATGRGDGVSVLVGMFAGVFASGLILPRFAAFFASTSHGTWTLPQLLHVPYGVVVALIVVVALAAFRFAEHIERRPFRTGEFRADARSTEGRNRDSNLAYAAVVSGAMAGFAGSPYVANHGAVDVQALSRAIANENDHVTAVELAAWIKERRPDLRVVDVRTPDEFDAYHVPTAERISIDSIGTSTLRPSELIVLYSEGGAHAAQAWVLLRALGYKNVYFLRGGLYEWLEQIISPSLPTNASPKDSTEFVKTMEISRYFGGVAHSASDLPESSIPLPAGSGRDRGPASTVVARIRRRGC